MTPDKGWVRALAGACLVIDGASVLIRTDLMWAGISVAALGLWLLLSVTDGDS